MFIAWRCIYAEIQRSRSENSPMRMDLALARTIDMTVSRLNAYGHKWERWVSNGEYMKHSRAIPRKHWDKGILQQEASGEYSIHDKLMQLWNQQKEARREGRMRSSRDDFTKQATEEAARPWQAEPAHRYCEPVDEEPPEKETPSAKSALHTSHAERIARASTPFGVLAIAVTQRFPETATVQKHYEDVISALDLEEARTKGANELDYERAREAARQAWYQLRSDPSRRRAWDKIRFQRAARITHEIECPIDLDAIQEYISSPESLEIFKTQRATSRTGRGLMTDFLKEVERDSKDHSRGSIKIRYRLSELGEQLYEAGFILDSRVYAIGADPFKLKRN